MKGRPMHTMLTVISNENATNSQAESWRLHLDATGVFLSSQLPSTLPSFQPSDPLTLEMVVFDKPLNEDTFSKLATSHISFSSDLTILDLGSQEWSLPHMQALLHWMKPTLKRIQMLKLANASLSLDALRLLIQFFQDHTINIDTVDFGAMQMSLPRVDLLATLVSSPSMKVKKIDFGHSRWSMSHMKSFLWSVTKLGYNIQRVALSSIECPAVGVDLLVKHMVCLSSDLRVLSAGITPLSDSSHTLILQALLLDQTKLKACVFSYQCFSSANTKLLWQVIRQSTSLERLALMQCQWYHDCVEVMRTCDLSIAKLYVEHSFASCYKSVTSVLEFAGYAVDKQTNDGKKVWFVK